MKTLSQFVTLGVATLLLVVGFNLFNSILDVAIYTSAFLMLLRFLPLNVNVSFVLGVLLLSMLSSSLFRYIQYDLLWFPYAEQYGYKYWQLGDVGKSLVEVGVFYLTAHLIFLRPFILNNYFNNEDHSITPADPLLIKIFQSWLVKLEVIAIVALFIHFIFESSGNSLFAIELADFVLIYLYPNIKLLILAFALAYAFTELKAGGEISPHPN